MLKRDLRGRRWVAFATVVLLAAGACGNRGEKVTDAATGLGAPAPATTSPQAPVPADQPAPEAGTAAEVTPSAGSAAPVATPSGGAVPSGSGGAAAKPRAAAGTGGAPAGRGPTPAAAAPGTPPSAQASPSGGTPSAASQAPSPAPGAAASAGPARYDQGASDREVKFGAIASLTGLFNDFMLPQGARGYFKFINSQGGLNGRKLSLLLYDDQWDVTRNAALTRQAVESDKVFAFVANMAPLTSHGGMPYLEAHNIPVIGGDMIDLKNWGKNPMFYPQSYLESVVGGRLDGRWAKEAGCKKVAGITLAVDESRSFINSFEQGMEDVGLGKMIYKADVSFAETDYTPYAATAKSRGADCMTMGGESSNYIRLVKSAEQQDYHPKFIWPSAIYDPTFFNGTKGNHEGHSGFVQYDIFENAPTNPAVKEFIDNMGKFEKGVKQSGFTLLAWVSGKIAVEALRRMGNDITRQNMIDTLNSLKNYDNGITPPLSYAPGPHQATTCGNLVQIVNDQYVLKKKNACLETYLP